MKTYRQHVSWDIEREKRAYHGWFDNGRCTCVRQMFSHIGQRFIPTHEAASFFCRNCGGDGIMPIPLRELK